MCPGRARTSRSSSSTAKRCSRNRGRRRAAADPLAQPDRHDRLAVLRRRGVARRAHRGPRRGVRRRSRRRRRRCRRALAALGRTGLLDGVTAQVSFSGSGGDGYEPEGVPQGTEVAQFARPDLDGQVVGLDDLRGRQLVLVNWSPSCGFCSSIAAELASLAADLRAHDTELVLLAFGSAEESREVLDTRRAVVHRAAAGRRPSRPLRRSGRPVAVPGRTRARCRRVPAHGRRQPGSRPGTARGGPLSRSARSGRHTLADEGGENTPRVSRV